MPRTIKYTKAIGSLKPGDTEVRSDIDANILVVMGVAEEVTEEESPMAKNRSMAAAPITSSGGKKGKKGKNPKGGEGKKGYRRRDMTAERRP